MKNQKHKIKIFVLKSTPVLQLNWQILIFIVIFHFQMIFLYIKMTVADLYNSMEVDHSDGVLLVFDDVI